MKGLGRDPAKRQPTVDAFAADVAKATQQLGADSEKKGLWGMLGAIISRRTDA
jgi:hypothetical protein